MWEVEDLVTPVAIAADGVRNWRAATVPEEVVVAPTFAGTAEVAGADADLVAGGLLLDVKATANPARLPTSETVWQTAGYVLLDYDDEYRIDRVGWYLAR